MGQFRPLLITISIIQIQKKCRWCACDSNPWPHDGRRRRYNRASAVAYYEMYMVIGDSFT